MNLGKKLLLIILCAACCGCSDEKRELERYVENVKQTATGSIEKIPELAPVKDVQYTAEAFRSPFVPANSSSAVTDSVIQQPKNTNVVQQPRPDIQRPREYLEQFPLEELLMVGTLSKPNVNWGLIKDSRGIVHVVKVGNYIGQNSGKIIAITKDQIRLTETLPNGSGGWMQSRNALNLVSSTKKG